MSAATSPLPVRQPTDAAPVPRPWWHEPMVWLVIAGPVAVVVAGFITLGIAIRNPDPVVPDTAVRRASAQVSGEVSGTAPGAGSASRDPALMPAVQARNQGAASPARATPSTQATP